ncbi:MAG: PQQ-binding-like beta-propeller repeat protein [Planctomycetaceae bacterium]|jgi:outer membrane protein assembly factor BamB|nr:PQQ-binding-like beta-propeller repeat protein [Planctomycetaceae bacterium]MBT6484436.1 PQQ-binding-like beta-propeller repeat protein [Planctomycetaceae bacterium]MBT6494919.1 PQQ-binding-like beta-propeller repeat protein [Planctomycetaceae bacterium]
MFSLLISIAISANPGDVWPAFRGGGNSVSAAKHLPLKWSDKDGVAWTTKLPGTGQSSPVIWENRAFVTAVAGNNKETAVVVGIDLASGRVLWQKEFKSSETAKISNYTSQAAPTPAVDAERVYAFFETGNLAALDHNGKAVWQRSLTTDYGKFLGNHGLGSSIALTDDAVIVLVDHGGPSYLLAVNKTTGETLWKSDRPQKVSWSSPVVTQIDGESQIIISSNGTCEAIDSKNGKQLWVVEGLEGNTVPSATVADDLVIVGSSKVGANVAIRRGGTGNVTKTHLAWKSSDGSATFSSPLAHRGHVYMVNRAGVAFCLDANTGKNVWKQRIGESCWASPLGAGDRVYFFSKSGTTTVVAAGAKLNVLAKNVLPTADRVYGVAAVDAKLLIRTSNRLVCISETEGGTTVSEPTTENASSSQKLPALPRAITSFGAAVLDDALYIYGGFHGVAHHYSDKGQSGDLLRLDLKKPTEWKVVAKGPKLQGHALVAQGGKLYRVGGFTAKNKDDEDQDLWSVPDFARFDPKTSKWEELPPMPSPRSSFDAIAIDDTIYVVGGWSMQGDKEADWQETAIAIDLSKSPLKWKEVAKPPFQRRALSVGTINGKLHAIGGMQPNGKITTNTAVYDPKTDSWSKGPKLPGDDMNGFGSACFPLGKRLFVTTATGKVLTLSNDGKSWTPTGKTPTARFFHRMLPVDDNHFGLLGGASMKTGKFSEVELLKIGQ